MRNRSGYMINPLTGRQVKMNGNVAKNVFKMVGGASASEGSSAPLGVHLDQAQQQLSQQTVAMEASLNEQKSQLNAAEEAMKAAQSAQEEATRKEQEAQSAVDSASAEKEAALQRETDVKNDLLELGKLVGNLSASLEKTAQKSKETDTSPFCTFERLEKSLTAEDKEKIQSDEGKKLFDEVTGLIGSVSNIVSTTVNYLGLFSSENRGRRAAPVQQNVNQNENLTMLGGGRRKQRRSSQKKRNNK